MYHVSAQGVDERMINVHSYYCAPLHFRRTAHGCHQLHYNFIPNTSETICPAVSFSVVNISERYIVRCANY